MNLFSKKISIIFLIINVFIFIFLIWYYPIQRFLALKDFNKYITAQGTNIFNIKSKNIFKDYKQDGYYIEVIFYDDPNLTYSYKWFVNYPDKKNTFNILLTIYKDHISVDCIGIQPKYTKLNK